MRAKALFSGIGTILLFYPLTMLVPIIVGLLYLEPVIDLLKCFLLPALTSFTIGMVLTSMGGRADRSRVDIRPMEAMVVVSLIWISISALGALPFMLSQTIPNFIDAFFETMSGFTTTGASVLVTIDGLDRSILFWRAFTQWLGGMGIIVLMVALFQVFLGGPKTGLMLMKGEIPGHSAEKLVPRIKETAKFLWLTYLALTVIGSLLLTILGMSVYDSVCHTFTALATGGYSTHTASIGYFKGRSTYTLIELALGFLMIIGSVNFVLHYNLLFKRDLKGYWRNLEFKTYIAIILIFTCFIALQLALTYTLSPDRSIVESFFNVASIVSTTGFVTEDFGIWPSFSQFLLLILMLLGGMTNSTTGGIKTARVMVVTKALKRSLTRIGHPKAAIALKLGRLIMPERLVKMIGMFTFGYLATFLIGSLLMSMTGLDAITSLSSVAATLGNVGPGLGQVGPMYNYSFISPVGKLILSMLMWLGRLELITGFILFIPSTYKT